MDFADEPYVRLFIRDTKTWLRLGFEGQCVLMFLLRKLDRAGVLDGMDALESDVSLITGVPLDIVRVGMPRLLEQGVIEHVGDRVIMPNFLQAQSAVRSDRTRSRDLRERRAARARHVTPRDETSRETTPPHDPPRPATPSLAFPNLTQPSLALPDPESARVVEPIHNGAGTRRPRWESFPEGWRWSDETRHAAAMVGVTVVELQEHVDFWTTRAFSIPVIDLDGELRRSIGDIKTRRETQRAKAKRVATSTGTRPYGSAPSTPWEPTSRHRAYAAKHQLDIEALAREFRLAEVPARRTLHECNEEFGRRMSLVAKGGTMGLEAVL